MPVRCARVRRCPRRQPGACPLGPLAGRGAPREQVRPVRRSRAPTPAVLPGPVRSPRPVPGQTVPRCALVRLPAAGRDRSAGRASARGWCRGRRRPGLSGAGSRQPGDPAARPLPSLPWPLRPGDLAAPRLPSLRRPCWPGDLATARLPSLRRPCWPGHLPALPCLRRARPRRAGSRHWAARRQRRARHDRWANLPRAQARGWPGRQGQPPRRWLAGPRSSQAFHQEGRGSLLRQAWRSAASVPDGSGRSARRLARPGAAPRARASGRARCAPGTRPPGGPCRAGPGGCSARSPADGLPAAQERTGRDAPDPPAVRPPSPASPGCLLGLAQRPARVPRHAGARASPAGRYRGRRGPVSSSHQPTRCAAPRGPYPRHDRAVGFLPGAGPGPSAGQCHPLAPAPGPGLARGAGRAGSQPPRGRAPRPLMPHRWPGRNPARRAGWARERAGRWAPAAWAARAARARPAWRAPDSPGRSCPGSPPGQLRQVRCRWPGQRCRSGTSRTAA